MTLNSFRYIKKCVFSYSNSILSQGLNAEFLIVDNGSTDGTITCIENEIIGKLPSSFDCRLFKLGKNLGTTLSRNIALRESNGEYIVICDSDTEFIDGKWENAFNLLSDTPTVGILAPYIKFKDGTPQPTVRLFPTLPEKILKIGNIFFKLPVANKDFYSDFPWKENKQVDTAASAFWLFRKELLKEIGYLDEKIFFTPEDVDFCLRVWKANKQVVFFPDMKIMHDAQRISHRKPLSYLSILHFWGLLYFYIKHGYIFSRSKIYRKIYSSRVF